MNQSLNTLISRGSSAYQGALSHGENAGLAFNTATVLGATLHRITGTAGQTGEEGTLGAYNRAAADFVQARASVVACQKTAIAFCATAVDVLKPFLGRSWNGQWRAAGFSQGSLAQPTDPMALLLELRAFFRQNPEKESPVHTVTAAKADALVTELGSARQRTNSARQVHKAALLTRNETLAALNKRLTALRKELSLIFAPDDPRWFDFGFPRPADGRIPYKMTGLSLRPGGPGEVIATWKRSVRALNYRVRVQAAGDTGEPEQVAFTPAKEVVIPNLRTGTRYLVLVSAANDAGETLPIQAEIALP